MSYSLITFDIWKFGYVLAAATQIIREFPLLEVSKRPIACFYSRVEVPRCRLWCVVSPGAHFAGWSVNITSGENVFNWKGREAQRHV